MDDNLDTGNSVGYIMGGIALLAVIALSMFSVPAWIWLIVIVVAGIVFSGGDLALAEKQYARRDEAERVAKSNAYSPDLTTPMSEQQKLAHEKADILADDPARMELLRDLECIGTDTRKFAMMSTTEIEASLTKEDRILLREMRGFLQ